ncbi:hypothetical protein ACNPN0_12895 [Glutamicibacter sp. AGC84]
MAIAWNHQKLLHPADAKKIASMAQVGRLDAIARNPASSHNRVDFAWSDPQPAGQSRVALSALPTPAQRATRLPQGTIRIIADSGEANAITRGCQLQTRRRQDRLNRQFESTGERSAARVRC